MMMMTMTMSMIMGPDKNVCLSYNESIGNCEEELPKKPVGRLSADCRPTVDRQSADSLPTG